jgi:hypothetical protein
MPLSISSWEKVSPKEKKRRDISGNKNSNSEIHMGPNGWQDKEEKGVSCLMRDLSTLKKGIRPIREEEKENHRISAPHSSKNIELITL